MATKTKTQRKNRDEYQALLDNYDLAEWWDEFINTPSKNGTLKYPTVYSFIKKKAKTKKEKEFLWWVLGPPVDSKEKKGHKFEKYPQFDWEAKREKGSWFVSKNVEELKQEVRRSHSAMDAIKAMGEINLDVIGRLKSVAEQIDREFGGKIFLPDLSMKENAFRSKLYFQLQEQLVGLFRECQLMFARTQGIDMERLEGILAMFGPKVIQHLAGASAIQGASEDEHTKSLGTVAEQLNKMLVAKAVDYELQLPSKEMEDVVKKAPITIDIKNKKPN